MPGPGGLAGGVTTMLVTLGSAPSGEPDDLVGLLLACHARIRRFSGLARTLGLRKDLPDAEVREACDAVIRYFTQALPLHVADEEQSVLPRLLRCAPALEPVLRQMEAQHAEHDPHLEALMRSLEALRGSPQDATIRAQVARDADVVARGYAEHLVMEEAILFPALRREVPIADQERMRDELRARRAPPAAPPPPGA